MGLKEKILDDMKDALKNKESERLNAIRFLQSAVKNREIELRPASINDQEILGVIKKLAKQRKDSIEQFEKASRNDLVEKEKFELGVLESYLPRQMSEAELGHIVEAVLKSAGATSLKQMGAVIKEVQARTAGAADNKMISEMVKSRLS